MSTSWENTYIYAFPLFSMIWPTISKVEKEEEKALIIVPMWPNTELIHTGTRISQNNTYYYRELTPPSARHQQRTPALPAPQTKCK